MSFSSPILRQERRLAGFAAALALHLALFYGWRLAHPHHARPDDPDGQRIEWVTVRPPRPVQPVPPKPRERAAPAQARHAPQPATPQPQTSAIEPAPIAMPVPATVPAAQAAPARSADDIRRQASRDLGKIDKDLQKEFPGAHIKAPVDTPQTRLEKGFEEAAELAPPKWYEAPKIKEMIDPGGYGRRRYRVTTAAGTYCVTYESNHAPDGLDTMKNGIKPKITTCPEHEQGATTQKW
jgi:hypothetical protein